MTFAPRPRAALLDAGFTLTSYDGTLLASFAAEAGARVDPGAVEATEPAVRREMVHSTFQFRADERGATSSGARFYRRILELAGVELAEGASLDVVAAHVWARHLERNVFRRVIPGVPEALRRLRQAGLRLAVVSNSEGTIEAMLRDVGLVELLDAVVDSWIVGVAKPDPRIFRLALDRLGVTAEQAVMVGDSPHADVAGARAVGAHAALIDPLSLHPDAEAPRFPDLAAFADVVLG